VELDWEILGHGPAKEPATVPHDDVERRVPALR
jgi:hypothetical protein